MNVKWPLVQLSEILTERKEIPDPAGLASGDIRIVAKIGFDSGKMEFRLDGSTRTKMILIRPGDLVLSGINAAKGAIALYGDNEKQPASATIHYSAYSINREFANPIYLWRYFRSEAFRDILRYKLPNGIKTELKAQRFLSLKIPLPSLPAQNRIAYKLEKINAKLYKARNIHGKLESRVWAFLFSAINSVILNLKKTYPSMELNRLVDKDRGISYGIVQTGQAVEGGIPTLRAGDLQWFRINTQSVKSVNPSIESRYLRTRLRGGRIAPPHTWRHG